MPYDIPESWEWVRLRNLGTITSGGTPKSSEPAYYGGNIMWITPADMGKQQNNKLFTTSSKKISELGLQKSSAQLILKNSIVYSSRAPIGHINIVNYDFTTNQGCKSVTPTLVNLDFMYWLLQFRTKDIILRASGTTFKEISASGFGDTLLPLPPLAEQKRIVAQIERVLKKVEVYAESYNKLQELDKTFPDKLKKSILQYAMQGKLVAQNPNDEPVEVLLEKIRAEKQKLYEEGKLKKKDLAETVVKRGDDNSPYQDVPYDIPESWEWVRLFQVGNLQTGTTPSTTNKSYYNENYIPFIKPANFINGKLHITEYLSEKGLERGRLIPKNSILMVCIGGSRGKTALTTVSVSCNQQINCITPYSTLLSKFLYYYFITTTFQSWMETKATGTATPIVNKSIWGNFLLPLPSLAEQQRIVSKISQIFSMIENLV
ncbi:restriction endonuclease subunit S [Streptococcus hyointestinalis]